MTTQPPHPAGTRAGTWEPDVEQLACAAYRAQFEVPDWPGVSEIERMLWHQTVQVVIEAATAQAAAAGLVMVRREDMERLQRIAAWATETRIYAEGWGTIDDDLEAFLAVTPAPTPGGDER